MTRVVLDNQVFSTQPRGGVSRYAVELLRQYRGDPSLGVEALTPYRSVLNEHLLALDPVRFRPPPLPGPAGRARVLRAWNTARQSPASRGAVLHHTFFFPEGLRTPARARLCTVYDMIPELLPDEVPPVGHLLDAAKERYVRECDAVLCISATTRDDLHRTYGSLDKPVVVTPLAAGAEFADVAPREDEGYVLHVGQRFAYKNVDVLLRALAALPGQRLVCVGPDLTPEERARLEELGLADRVRRVEVSDAELPAVYAAATCLVLPSRYEGFGLPLVEAFASGCPALACQTPCLVEVGGDAAAYFAADDDQALAELIDRLRDDPAERQRRREAGRLRAADFTWRRTAALTADVYRELDRATR